MAIGNQVTFSTSSLNSELGQTATNSHIVMSANRELFERVNLLGISGLEAIGFSQSDAQAFIQTLGYLNTIAQVYFGTVAQNPAFNFDDAIADAR